MSEKELSDLYYDLEDGYTGFTKFYSKVKRIYPDVSYEEIKKFYDKQEISQLNKKVAVKKVTMWKIIGDDLTFQIDLMLVSKNLKSLAETSKKEYEKKTNKIPFLLCVEVTSRKAYIYKLDDFSGDQIIKAYKLFLKDLAHDIGKLKKHGYSQLQPKAITTDDQFDFADFMQLNNLLGISVDAQTAYNDHITAGDRLGIIDRLVRTLRNILMRVVYSLEHYSIPGLLHEIVINYNNSDHRGIKYYTPNEVFGSPKLRKELRQESRAYNITVRRRTDIDVGDTVRIYEPKKDFEKERPQFTKEIYKVIGMDGNKYQLQNSKGETLDRLFKPHELIVVTEVEKKNKENVGERIKKNKKEHKVVMDLKRDDIKEENIIVGKRHTKAVDRFVPK